MSKIISKCGYKHTELGWIPDEWEILSFGKILSEGKLGGNYENSEANNGIPVIKMGNINRGKINTNLIQCLPEFENFNQDDILKEGDLLFNTRNTLELVGKVAIWRNELPLALYNSNLMRMKFDSKKVATNFYMNYYFNSHIGLSQLRGFATGTTSVAAIYGRDLLHFKIPLPPLPEQKKIAEILSAWDKAIVITEKLIETKTKLKQGLMQKLLTGKLRFKEFKNKNWEKKKLSNFLLLTSYPVPKPTIPYTSLGIKSHGKGTLIRYVEDPNNVQMDILYEVKRDELIVNITFGWEGAITIVKPEDEGNLVSHRFPTFKFNTKVAIPDYFKHVVKTNLLVFQLGLISPGGAGRNRVLNKQDLLKLVWTLPSIKEQIKISSFLNSFDKDIDLLIKNLQSLKLQKKGLMQKLLMGEVRVKINEEEK